MGSYGLVSKFIGRVSSESKFSLEIWYCEGQQFSLRSWDPHYIERFSGSKEAVNYVSRINGHSKKKLTETILEDFPLAMRQEYLQALHDLLVSNKNYFSARTSP